MARRWPAVATAWSVLVGAVTVATLVLRATRPIDPDVLDFLWTDVVVGLTFPVLAMVVARAAPRNAIGYVLASVGLVGIGAFCRLWAYHGGVARPGSLPLAPRRGSSRTGRGRPTGCNQPSSRELTVREVEVLELVARGMDNHRVAQRLGLSEKTVRNRVSAILAKLHASTRAELVALARDHGLGA